MSNLTINTISDSYVPTAQSTPPQQLPSLPPALPNGSGRKPPKKDTFVAVLTTISLFLLAPLVAVLLTVFVFQSYQVDGPSMEPTLQNNDRLIVMKLPKTWSKITHHAYIPNRGDIIIFVENNLNALSESQPKQLVKRVVGLPGDRVVIKDDKLTVYNSQYPSGFDPDTTLPYKATVSSSASVTTGNIDITIPPGQVFVCGDNRTNSLDSRVFGPVPANDIVGKLVLRIFPISTTKKF